MIVSPHPSPSNSFTEKRRSTTQFPRVPYVKSWRHTPTITCSLLEFVDCIHSRLGPFSPVIAVLHRGPPLIAGMYSALIRSAQTWNLLTPTVNVVANLGCAKTLFRIAKAQ